MNFKPVENWLERAAKSAVQGVVGTGVAVTLLGAFSTGTLNIDVLERAAVTAGGGAGMAVLSLATSGLQNYFVKRGLKINVDADVAAVLKSDAGQALLKELKEQVAGVAPSAGAHAAPPVLPDPATVPPVA